MKKRIFSILAFVLVAVLLLSACNNGLAPSTDTTEAGDVTTKEPEGTTAEPNGTTTADPTDEGEPGGTTADNVTTKEPDATTVPGGDQKPEDETYKAIESYIPSSTMRLIKSIFESQGAQSGKVVSYVKQDTMPYALADVKTVSNGKLVSISIPVVKTDAKDKNGDFIFTVSVIGNTDAGLKGSVKRAYQIKINAERYGLTENNTSVFKFIKVDVSDYNIVLSADETLAFLAQEDTIYPAYLFKDNNAIVTFLEQQFPQATKYYNFGTSNEANGLKLSNNSLLYDFEFERTYETKADYDMANNYDAVLEAVKNAYKDKYFSILGDSISTFEGFHNDASANATIANNKKCYPYGDVQDYRYTYWGRLMSDTEMKLCVNNSWSGSHVIGTLDSKYASGYKDNMYDRATELDRDSGVNPDVIFVFMSTNDLIHNSKFGSLYTILNTNDGRTDKQKIDAWFTETLEKAETYSGNGTAFFENWSWDEAYALSLNAMKEKYPDAERFCMTLLPNTNTNYAPGTREKFNYCIAALAEYFGATVIDLNEGGINENNVASMTVDGLHPNMKGFAEVEKVIIKSLYKKATSK